MLVRHAMQVFEYDSPENIDKSFNTFQDKYLGKTIVFVIVVASWCGHCQRLKPELEKALQQVKNTKGKRKSKSKSKKGGATNDAAIVVMGDEAMQHMRDHHSTHTFSQVLEAVSGFPCIMMLSSQHNGTIDVDMYEGARDANSLVDYFTQKD